MKLLMTFILSVLIFTAKADNINIDMFSGNTLDEWNYSCWYWSPSGSIRITSDMYAPGFGMNKTSDYFNNGYGSLRIEHDENSLPAYPGFAMVVMKNIEMDADLNSLYLSFDVYKKNGTGSFKLVAYNAQGEEFDVSKRDVRLDKAGFYKYKFSLAGFPGSHLRNLRFVFNGDFEIFISNMYLTNNASGAEEISLDIFNQQQLQNWNYSCWHWSPSGSTQITSDMYSPVFALINNSEYYNVGDGALLMQHNENALPAYPGTAMTVMKYVGMETDYSDMYLAFDVYRKNGSGSFKLEGYDLNEDEFDISKKDISINHDGFNTYKFRMAEFSGDTLRNLRYIFNGNFEIGLSNLRLTKDSAGAEEVNIDLFDGTELNNWNYSCWAWDPNGSVQIDNNDYSPVFAMTKDNSRFSIGKGAVNIVFNSASLQEYNNISMTVNKHVGKRANWDNQFLTFDLYKKSGWGTFKLYAYTLGGTEFDVSKGLKRIVKTGTTQYKFSMAGFPEEYLRYVRFVFEGNFDISISNMYYTYDSNAKVYPQTDEESAADIPKEVDPPSPKPGDSDAISYFTMPYHQRGSQHDIALQTLDKLEIYSAKNEFEPVLLLMRSGALHESLEISLQGYFSSGSNAISQQNANIRIVRPHSRWLDYFNYIKYPFALMENSSFNLEAFATKRIWLTVKVPQNAQAGIYTNNLIIKQNGNQIKQIPVELKVYDFELPDIPADKKRLFIYSAPWEAPTGCDNEQYLLSYYRNIKDHGFNSLHIRALPDRPVEKDMVPAMAAGFANGHFIWSGAHVMADSSELDTTTQAVTNYGFKMFFYGIDEPNEPEKLAQTQEVVPKLKNRYPDITVLTAMDDTAVEMAGDYYDEWIMLAAKNSSSIMLSAVQKGKTVSGYECALSPNDSLTIRHLWGLYHWKADMVGMAQWVFASDIYDRFFDIKTNDGMLHEEYEYLFNLVILGNNGIIDSEGWENVREGIDDYRYIYKLEQLIENAPTPHSQKVIEGIALLDELKNKINIYNYSQAFSQASNIRIRSKAHAYERQAPEPALSIIDYDNYRKRTAQAIENILTEQ